VWAQLGSPAGLLTSAYGLTLLVKLILLATLLVPAFVNYRIVRPALQRAASSDAPSPDAPGVLHRFGRMLELEVTAGLLVIAVAGILGSVSPPLPDGTGRLNRAQIDAVTTPRLPQTHVVDPATWVGSATRTDDDLRYSEFMHNWSGLVVILLGTAWLLQASGGPGGRKVGRLWPLALIPFAIFVAIASDPEVWPMGDVDPIQALTDPIVLEHRIGALMIVLLAWLGMREERRGGEDRPLGRALPVLMIVGSLLLLGHAHSSFGASEELGTLINVQHAVLGGLGLIAGVVRWLELRGLFPRAAARVLWPSLVIAVGVFLAFSYRELVV
jgi:putative copper export protein